MNPITAEQLPPPPQPPQPHRNSTSCDRHPDEKFTGFCPSCLCERLAVLDNSSSSTAATNPGRKSASAAIKSLFNPDVGPTLRGRLSSSSFLPELRRTKSFSGGFDPPRRSSDLRGRDGEKRTAQAHRPVVINDPSTSSVVIELNADHGIHGVEEGNTRDEIEVLIEENNQQEVDLKPMKQHIDLDSQNKKTNSKDLKDLAGSFWSAASVFSKKLRNWTRKTQKNKKHLSVNGSNTVQIRGKKGRNYRDTQSEIAEYGCGRRSCDIDRLSVDAARYSVDVPMAGRYSVDAPMAGRYSVDAGRMSFDDGRCSFDEPRASWDGYLIGRNFPRMIPPMVSVVEDRPVCVSRTDTQIPVEEPRRSSVSVLPRMSFEEPRRSSVSVHPQMAYEEPRRSSVSVHPQMLYEEPRMSSVSIHAQMPYEEPRRSSVSVHAQMPYEEPRRSSVSINGDEPIPGGAAQTKDYYSDSSSRRRKSLDRSSSIRKMAASVVAEMDEINGCDAKVPPCVDYLNGNKVLSSRGLDFHTNANSLRTDYSESFDYRLRDNASVIGSNCDRKGSKKSSRWRGWNIWGLIYRRGSSKEGEDDREQSYSESWQDMREWMGPQVVRSNSSVSWKNASFGSFGSFRKGSIDTNGGGRRKKDEVVLERNRSARYSPSHGADNGLLRFYLAPMRGSRRGSSVKSKPAYSHSFARSVLRLY